jgi:hypothetical protein
MISGLFRPLTAKLAVAPGAGTLASVPLLELCGGLAPFGSSHSAAARWQRADREAAVRTCLAAGTRVQARRATRRRPAKEVCQRSGPDGLCALVH